VLFPTIVQETTRRLRSPPRLQTRTRWADSNVLSVARGGGSLEDLWAFNDERVVRAIAGSGIPTVSPSGTKPTRRSPTTPPTCALRHRRCGRDRLWPMRPISCSQSKRLAIACRGRFLRFMERLSERVQRFANHPALRDPAYRVRQGDAAAVG